MNIILGSPGVTHSVPSAFECSGYGMGHAWVTEDDEHYDYHRLVQLLEFVKLIHGFLYYLYSRDSLETYSCVSFQRDVEPVLQSGPQ